MKIRLHIPLIACFIVAGAVLASPETDSDSDGLPDVLETLAGLDPEKNECVADQCNAAPGPQYAVFLFDQSGSMDTEFGESTRIEAARSVSKRLVERLPESLQLGLYTYGPKECEGSVEIQSPFEKRSVDSVVQRIEGLQPDGSTPIGATLDEIAAKVQEKAGNYSIVLVTDGGESCEGDPVESARNLIAQSGADRNITLDVIGLDLEPSIREELASIAEASGGEFQNVTTQQQLENAIARPMRRIVQNLNEMMCLKKEMDALIRCEKNRISRIHLAYTKMSSGVGNLDASERQWLEKHRADFEEKSNERLKTYNDFKEKRAEALQEEIREMMQFLGELEQDDEEAQE